MRKTKDGRSPAAILLPSAAAGLLTTLFLMLIGAVLVHRGAVSDGMIAYLALAFLAVGCAAAAAVSAVRAPGAKFLWAMGAGTLVFLILLVLGGALLDQPVHIVRAAVSLVCALAASALGGLAGANKRKKTHYQKK